MTNIRTRRVTCSSCKKTTNHKVRAAYDHTESQEFQAGQFFDVTHTYLILQCAGCDTVAFLHLEPVDGEAPMEHQYPYPSHNNYEALFFSPADIFELPSMIAVMYIEVESAFTTESSVLAGIGLRTLVEAICIHQRIPGANLQEKIKKLHAKGLISAAELPILDKLRLIGNVSAHKVKGIPIDKLKYAMQIINHVLQSIYVLPSLNKKIKV